MGRWWRHSCLPPRAFLIDHGLQTATLLRLFRLLLWIGERFRLSGSRAI
jgi:hypothetical protein